MMSLPRFTRALLSPLLLSLLLSAVSPPELLAYLCARGGVDGVTGASTPTEDGLPASEGVEVIEQLRRLTGFG